MRMNISQETEEDIEKIVGRLLTMSEFKKIDEWYLEVKTPFITYPDSNNDEWKTKIGFSLYPELLTYYEKGIGDSIVPWICCKFEFEGMSEKMEYDLLKWITAKFKECLIFPFKDEDAVSYHFIKEPRKRYNIYKMYVNLDYPEGYWENHTLD